MTRSLSSPFFGLVALVAMGCSAATQEPAMAQNQATEPGRLTLSAAGQVDAAPDMASVSAGVVAEGKTAGEAMAGQRTAMNQVFAALEAAGVERRDIQTSGLNLTPQYANNYSSGRAQDEGPRIIGYMASNQVSVIARDLDKVGPTLDALVEAGVNTIGGVQFGLSNQEALEDEARKAAIAAVLARAELYAQTGGFQIGRILDMGENRSMPMQQERMMARSAAMDSTPVAGGQMSVVVTVHATFAIEE